MVKEFKFQEPSTFGLWKVKETDATTNDVRSHLRFVGTMPELTWWLMVWLRIGAVAVGPLPVIKTRQLKPLTISTDRVDFVALYFLLGLLVLKR